MANIFTKSKKNELRSILKGVLSRGLRPLFEVYIGLLKKVDKSNYESSCFLKELSQSSGYSTQEIQCILDDLATLNLIRYKIVNEREKHWTIKLLVY
jgi:hypothetical protein